MNQPTAYLLFRQWKSNKRPWDELPTDVLYLAVLHCWNMYAPTYLREKNARAYTPPKEEPSVEDRALFWNMLVTLANRQGELTTQAWEYVRPIVRIFALPEISEECAPVDIIRPEVFPRGVGDFLQILPGDAEAFVEGEESIVAEEDEEWSEPCERCSCKFRKDSEDSATTVGVVGLCEDCMTPADWEKYYKSFQKDNITGFPLTKELMDEISGVDQHGDSIVVPPPSKIPCPNGCQNGVMSEPHSHPRCPDHFNQFYTCPVCGGSGEVDAK